MDETVVTLVGGGLLLLSLAYLVLFILTCAGLRIPRLARVSLGAMAAGSCISGLAVGLAVLTGGSALGITTGQWSVAFIAVQLVGLWGFNAGTFARLLSRYRGRD